MTTRVVITDHAALRYIERHARGLSHAEARADMERLAGQATPLKRRSVNGQHLWRVDEPPMLLVIKPDEGRYVCVTVLPPSAAEDGDDGADAEIDAEVVGAYARIRHLVERGSEASAAAEAKALQADVFALCARLRERIDALKQAREAVKRDLRALQAAATGEAPLLAVLALPKKGTARHEINTLRAQLAALQRRYDVQLAHGERQSAERARARLLLASAMGALVRCGDPEARAAHAAIVAAAPWTGRPAFWDRPIRLDPEPPEERGPEETP